MGRRTKYFYRREKQAESLLDSCLVLVKATRRVFLSCRLPQTQVGPNCRPPGHGVDRCQSQDAVLEELPWSIMNYIFSLLLRK